MFGVVYVGRGDLWHCAGRIYILVCFLGRFCFFGSFLFSARFCFRLVFVFGSFLFLGEEWVGALMGTSASEYQRHVISHTE